VRKVTSGARTRPKAARAGLVPARAVPPVPPVPDVYAALVREAASGDPAAMERLLTRVQEVAWRFSMSVCGRADDAEDAMQEALIKTYRYTSRIREPEAFRPWLHRTVKNACLMNRRRRVHEPKVVESLHQARSGQDGAPIDPADSVRAQLQTLAALDASHSGQFLDRFGTPVAW